MQRPHRPTEDRWSCVGSGSRGSGRLQSGPSHGLGEAHMTLEERSNLVLAFARVLYVNGQATDQTAAAAGRLGRALGLRTEIIPRWGELELESEDKDARLTSQIAADPVGV